MRIYNITTHNVSMASVLELAEIKGAAGKMVFVLRMKWGASDTTIPTAQMIDTSLNFLPATVTDQTGGSSTTAHATDPGDANPSVTAKTNGTAASTSSGTAVIIGNYSEHIYNGLDLRFAMPGSEGGGLPPAPVIGPSEALAWVLNSTVSGTVHGDMTITVGEVGG